MKTLLVLLLFITPCFADYSPAYKPSGECRVVKNGEILKSYPPFDYVTFYVKQDAEQYRYLVDGVMTDELGKNEWHVIDTHGLDMNGKEFNCYGIGEE